MVGFKSFADYQKIEFEDGIKATEAMISATGITIGGLLAYIAFNMTTIPCFASVATARGELKKGTAKWTILFWILTSYIISTIVYIVLSCWWTAFIVLAVIIVAAALIKIYNKKVAIKK